MRLLLPVLALSFRAATPAPYHGPLLSSRARPLSSRQVACFDHATPAALPDPLPANLTAALAAVEVLARGALDAVSVPGCAVSVRVPRHHD